jgi:phosphatidylglycerol:prolipoprotein diacylglycerol transferase
MHPELFQLPFFHLTIKSYGLMMVLGFLAAVSVIRYLSRHFTANPIHITNAALYSLIAGIVGARIFFVLHYPDQFRGDPWSVFAIWNGGLELVGGVLLAIGVIIFYIWYHKLPMRHYLDVLAIGLTAALIFGRIGCFLNGCCYGRPSEVPWAVQFPYGSFSYRSQVRPDLERNRPEPYVALPDDFFGYTDEQGVHVDLKPWKDLTPRQKELVTTGPYHARAVHPTQLYSSAGALLLGLILYGFWRRSQRAEKTGRYPFLTRPGSTFSLMFILYSIMRFIMEAIRDDNPFETAGLTISQIFCIGLAALGVALVVFYTLSKPEKPPVPASQQRSKGQALAATR